MADQTKIEWTDATANVVNGCSLASPGCTNCYAMRLAGTRLRTHPTREGLTVQTKAGPVWNGEVRFNDRALQEVLKWTKPRMIFWNAHGDIFHENVPDDWIDRCFAAMARTPHHIHQVLTKRSQRMREYLCGRKAGAPLSIPLGDGTCEQHPFNNELKAPHHIWLGVSVEDQKRANERVPDLLATPAAIRWLSCEPLLGPVELGALPMPTGMEVCDCPDHRPTFDALNGSVYCEGCCEGPERFDTGLDWIVGGGESGKGARPMHPKWARNLCDQCAEAGVPFFFKQWGEWVTEDQSPEDIVLPGTCTGFWGATGPHVYKVGKKAAGRLLDGVEHNGMPEARS